MEVGSLHEGQEEASLERMRQKRLAAFIDQTEVIEMMVYVDKLMYDRYRRNRATLERHILAIMNLVCACICISTCWCVLVIYICIYIRMYIGVCEMCEVCACLREVDCCAQVQHTTTGAIVTLFRKHEHLQLVLSPALPQFAAIMQEPSIGRPVYIRVVRMIIETGQVSGSAIFISMIKELRDPANVKFTD